MNSFSKIVHLIRIGVDTNCPQKTIDSKIVDKILDKIIDKIVMSSPKSNLKNLTMKLIFISLDIIWMISLALNQTWNSLWNISKSIRSVKSPMIYSTNFQAVTHSITICKTMLLVSAEDFRPTSGLHPVEIWA